MLNLDHFIADCRAALAERSPELAIREILERVVANPFDVEAALGTPRQAQITPLHHDRDLTILNIVWTPGMAVYPHDHRMWALIGLYGGREDNTFYRRSPEGLQVAGGKQLETGDATLLGPAIIHAVQNPLRIFTGAIHIYGVTSSAPREVIGTPKPSRSGRTTSRAPERSSRTRTSGGLPSARGRVAPDPCRGHHRSARRSSCALTATMIVLTDISTAPSAGGSTTPQGASTPAATGIATML